MRQEFWSDEVLAALPDPVRLFYIGLWCVADDAGWLRWNPARVAALLYPYRLQKARERQVAEWMQTLANAGRVTVMDCGCAVIPTLSRHQVNGGKLALTEKNRHLAEHVRKESPGSPGSPESPAGRVEGRGGNGRVIARERETTDATEAMRDAFRRRGLPVDTSV